MNNVFDDVAAFPLCWPDGWARTERVRRESGSRFGNWTVYTATERLLEELRLMGAKETIISTSISLRRDGLPLSKPPVDGDPGVAVYFFWKKQPTCIACDRYQFVEFNIRALTLTIEAMRAIERHGSSDLLNRAFTGFAALPAPDAPKPWYVVMNLPPSASLDQITATYRDLARMRHPDTPGGSTEAFQELQSAYESAKAARNG